MGWLGSIRTAGAPDDLPVMPVVTRDYKTDTVNVTQQRVGWCIPSPLLLSPSSSSSSSHQQQASSSCGAGFHGIVVAPPVRRQAAYTLAS